MEIVRIYKCLCDLQRLRILNLLKEGPLCVCHLVDILEADQVKISKQLKYMKAHGMVEGERQAQWMIYRLANPAHPILMENLKCLQDFANEKLCFEQDLRKRGQVVAALRRSNEASSRLESICCG
ncbi:MAG: metalloregulator ArsR/SmtB family transcription factor [Opitutaceae bacterium]